MAPSFIDWSSHRALFEEQASRIVGHPVRVKGEADARFLPLPTFTFTDIEVGAGDNPKLMTADALNVRVELMPLLQRRIEVVDMHLKAPQLNIRFDGANHTNWHGDDAEEDVSQPYEIKLGPVTIENGEIYIADPEKELSLKLSDLRTEMTAQSLHGPWKITGTGLKDDDTIDFQINTGRFESGALRMKTTLSSSAFPVTVLLDGMLNLIEPDGTDRKPAFNGSMRITEESGDDETGPTRDRAHGWTLEGTVELDRDKFLLSQALFEDGAEAAPLNLNGALRIPFGPNMRFDAVVSSRQIDLDRAYGEGPTAPVALDRAIAAVGDVLRGLPKPPIDGTIGVDIPGIVVGGNVMRSVHFDVMPMGDGWRIADLGAQLPGLTRLVFDGHLSTDDDLLVDGTFEMQSERPISLARWLRPARANDARRLRLSRFDLAGQISAEAGALRLDGLKANLGESDFAGSFAYNSVSARQHRFDADLTARRLNTDSIRALSTLFVGTDNLSGFDADDTIDLKLTADTLVAEGIEGKMAEIDMQISLDKIDIEALRINDFAGAEINAVGTLTDLTTAPSGRLRGQLNASSVEGLRRVATGLLPDHPLVRYLNDHGSAIAPLDLEFNFSGIQQQAGNGITQTDGAATVKGMLGGGDIAAGVRFVGDWANPKEGALDYTLSASYTRAEDLLRQVAWPLTDIGESGSAQVEISGSGRLADGADTVVEMVLADTTTRAALDLRLGDDNAISYDGHLTVGSDNADSLIQVLGFAYPGFGLGLDVDLKTDIAGKGVEGSLSNLNAMVAGETMAANLDYIAAMPGSGEPWSWRGAVNGTKASLEWLIALGTGETVDPMGTIALKNDTNIPEPEFNPTTALEWPDKRYADAYFQNTKLDLDVTLETLDVAGLYEIDEPVFHLRMRDNDLEITDLKGGLADGTFSASLRLQNSNGNLTVRGGLDLRGAPAAILLWSDENRPLVEGRLGATAQFEGTGRSLAAVIASLGGGGTIRLDDASLRRMNPQAFMRVVAAADRDITIDEATLRPLIHGYLDAGRLSVDNGEAAFTINSGVIRVANAAVPTDSVDLTASGALDLNTFDINAAISLSVDGETLGETPVTGAAPEIAALFTGNVVTPERSLDLQSLIGYLTVRRFEQEVERVERLQADILEKQRLSRYARWVAYEVERERLLTEEQERLRQEEERRRQEEEARREQAAREAAERQRQEAARQINLERDLRELEERLLSPPQEVFEAPLDLVPNLQ